MAESIKSRSGLEVRRRIVAIAAIAAALTAAACNKSESGEATSVGTGSSSAAPATTTTTAPTTTTTEQTPTTTITSAEQSAEATLTREAEGPYFTFDSLGGGSSVIQVYAGPGESAADRQPVGTYYDGDTVPVDCVEVDGRELSSDPSVGEQKKTSDIWFGTHNPVTEQEFYASYVYGAPSVVPDSLPDC